MTKYAARIIDANLEEELGESFGRYAKATILDRAIPDVRDGLKPVQRRIVYAMYRAGNRPDKRYRKSAKTVGDVMGNFHPHGDQSIYDAMVRMAQDWKMRAPLVDGHGNFGSIDDDPPAAMRYTEARMAAIAMELVRDIEKDTVIFQPNFDDSDSEPTVLPSRYPNMLVNGTSGVSTGFSTEVQPHNLTEVIHALVAMIDDPEIDLDGVMKHIQGPDFPTGGVAMDMAGLRKAYETGKGRIVLRAKTEIAKARDGRNQIVVHEIPYGVIKSNLVKEIEKLRISKVVQGIKDVRDETDREGLRIVVDLGRGSDAESILAYLHKKTDLQVYRHFQMVAIVDRSPRLLGLLEILSAYLAHQREVVTRRSRYDLARAKARLHIVEGLIRAVDVLDEVIAIIRSSSDRAEAHQRLMATFDFSEEQTKEILDLRLHRLTGLQIKQLRSERKGLKEQIKSLEAILNSYDVLMQTIRQELLSVLEVHGEERRTLVSSESEKIEIKIRETVTVKPQDVVVGISDSGYAKRSSQASYEKTEGEPELAGAKEGDYQRWILQTNTLHRLLLFTEKGQCCTVAVHQIPECRWGDIGTALVNVVGMDKDDRIIDVVQVESFGENDEVVFVTEKGSVKRSMLKLFDSARTSGVVSIKLSDGDRLIRVISATASDEIVIATVSGHAIRFPLAQVSVQGRSAGGVRGINLRPNDLVIDAAVMPGKPNPEDEPYPFEIAIVTREGRAKRTPIAEYPLQRRGGRGVRCVTQRQRMPHRVGAVMWWPADKAVRLELRLVLNNGTAQTQPVSKMRYAARDGNGYEYADNVPSRVYLGAIYLNELPLPEGSEDDSVSTETTEAVQPAETAETVEKLSETPEPETDESGASGKGSWTQDELFPPGIMDSDE